MLVKDFAAMVHENAVKHGWYDKGGKKLSMEDFLALIHSEWSEALEEARAGRPFIWYSIYDNDDDCGGGGRCSAMVDEGVCPGRNGKCELNHKPEGCAVELADGCLRILDLFGYGEIHVEPLAGTREPEMEDLVGIYSAKELGEMPGEDEVPKLVTWLHAATSEVMLDGKNEDYDLSFLLVAMSMALAWIQQRGIDPIKLLMLKHEYNKSRPYKHGNKKF